MNAEKDENIALKAGFWYVISSIMVKASSIITTPIFTRLMTTGEYGLVATFTSWYSMMFPFCTMNLMYSIGRAKLDFPGKMEEYTGSMQLFSAVVTLLISLVVFIILEPISKLLGLSEFATILLMIYLLFEPSIIFYQNRYRYLYMYKQNIAIAWYTVIAPSLLSLFLMLTQNGNMAQWRIIGMVLPIILLSSIFWIKSIKLGYIRYNKSYWRYAWGLSAPLILHAVSANILAQSDRLFIAKLCGTSDTGIYSLVYTYSLMLAIITGAVSDGWLPWFHDALYLHKKEEIRKNIKPLIVVGCYIGLACIATAPEALRLLGGVQYLEGLNGVMPIVLGVVCKYIYTHYVNIEMHLKKTKYVAQGTVIAALINIVLNAIFIPLFGYIAAAYTTLVSYMFLLLIHYVITKQILKVHLYNDKFMFGSLVATAGLSCLIVYSYRNNILRWCLIILGFMSFIYFFRNYILRGRDLLRQMLYK